MDSISLLLGGLTYEEEANLIKALCYLLFISFSGFLIFTVFIHQAPYGRYARQPKWMWGCPLNARVGWFVQEFPSLLIPILCLLLGKTSRDGQDEDSLAANWILLACFIAHYIHRYDRNGLLHAYGFRCTYVVSCDLKTQIYKYPIPLL